MKPQLLWGAEVGDYGPREEYGRIRERSYRRGSGWDRERRLQTTIGVGAGVLLVVGIAIGFAWGRATAPKAVTPEQTPAAIIEETTLPVDFADEVPTETIEPEITDETDASFETTEDAPPSKPRQLAPANGAVLNTSRVNLRWTKSTDEEGPVTYSFEIQNRRSNGTYGSTQVIKGLKTTSYSARVLSVRRRWRVWAVDAEGNASAKSGWRTYRGYVAPQSSDATKSVETT